MIVRIPQYGVTGRVLERRGGYVDVIDDEGACWTVPEAAVEEVEEDDVQGLR